MTVSFESQPALPTGRRAITFGGGRPPVYKTKDGKRVPSVTTITKRFQDAGGLIGWAHKMGLEGRDMREEKDDAATAGKIAHAWIDDSIHGRPLCQLPRVVEPDGEIAHRARKALSTFEVWREQVRLEILDTERPLVSEAHRFGGTYDAVGLVGGDLSLVDWKTSNAVYGDYVVQVSAYAELYREHMGRACTGAHLLRVGKEWGDFHYHFYPVEILRQGWEAFLLMRRLYELDAVLKKVAG
jgi:hypothetical protein